MEDQQPVEAQPVHEEKLQEWAQKKYNTCRMRVLGINSKLNAACANTTKIYNIRIKVDAYEIAATRQNK